MSSRSRDEAHWAKPVPELHLAHDLPPDALNLNVEGRRVAAVAGGFGKMWQKTYRIALSGSPVGPEEVVAEWKQHFPEFWPKGARFLGPLAQITPGDVALLNIKKPGAPVLSTGVLVAYADDVSFSFICPEGHLFVGMITFSAHRDASDGGTVAQVQLFIRPADPLAELMMTFGGHRLEDKQWKHVLRQVAAHFGVDAEAEMVRVLVDRKRQWRYAGNIRRSSVIKSGVYAITKPFRLKRDPA